MVHGTKWEHFKSISCQAAMANTSVGRQAASSERLVRKVAGSRGVAGGQKGGDVD